MTTSEIYDRPENSWEPMTHDLIVADADQRLPGRRVPLVRFTLKSQPRCEDKAEGHTDLCLRWNSATERMKVYCSLNVLRGTHGPHSRPRCQMYGYVPSESQEEEEVVFVCDPCVGESHDNQALDYEYEPPHWSEFFMPGFAQDELDVLTRDIDREIEKAEDTNREHALKSIRDEYHADRAGLRIPFGFWWGLKWYVTTVASITISIYLYQSLT